MAVAPLQSITAPPLPPAPSDLTPQAQLPGRRRYLVQRPPPRPRLGVTDKAVALRATASTGG